MRATKEQVQAAHKELLDGIANQRNSPQVAAEVATMGTLALVLGILVDIRDELVRMNERR